MAWGYRTTLQRPRRPVFRPGSALPVPGGLTTPASSAPAPGAGGGSSPAPSYNAPDIRDAAYNDAINTAWRTKGDVYAAVAGAQANLRSRYGYLDDNMTIDPNNPFGQAQLLKRSYDQTRSATQSSYGDRGLQTSGAYGAVQSGNLFNYQQSNDALQKSFLQENADLIQRLNEAEGAYGQARIQASADALGRSIDRRQVGTQPQGQPQGLGADEVIRKSAAHGGQAWIYKRRASDGKLIPIRRA